MIEFFLNSYELKDEKRTGWQLRDIEEPESVADHSWGTAVLTMVYGSEEDVDTDKCVRMALVHDLAEYSTGDLVTRADSEAQEISKDKKNRLEHNAMEELGKTLDGEEMFNLWQEYEERETSEARFVKDMDMIDMCVQALKYERQERYNPGEENEHFTEYSNLDEFFVTTENRLNTETGKELFYDIRERYEEAKQK